eukprot:s1017_g3.t1
MACCLTIPLTDSGQALVVCSALEASSNASAGDFGKAAVVKARRESLDKIAGYKDRDLFTGRFQRASSRKEPTSSTRGSTANDMEAGEAAEESLKKFLQKDLLKFFASPNDSCLFLKLLVADGMVS